MRSRRRYVLSAAATMLGAWPVAAQSGTSFGYRSFTVDTSANRNLPDHSAIDER
ncbi:hypothetical protein QA640_12585 [Bradyrhizobium sp. CB82]|uniref:hypothetical protein n=1 Tax=Bradyrhizobium sp. CB82 TaxID=3039159 RepID=UPI0024B1B5B6|nr:hypothetical protein [Bradyrhizobium sp. CB82]WFU43207.1 hypothetical protein QA640_12585 [Bradyrhizobium sp. CB82]